MLLHLHVNAPPFTCSLGDVPIPANLRVVTIRARANLTGHEGRRATVDLHEAAVERFSVGMVTAGNCSDERDRIVG